MFVYASAPRAYVLAASPGFSPENKAIELHPSYRPPWRIMSVGSTKQAVKQENRVHDCMVYSLDCSRFMATTAIK